MGTFVPDGGYPRSRMSEIGWQVVDPEGIVIASGPITEAEMTAELRQALGLPPEGE